MKVISWFFRILVLAMINVPISSLLQILGFAIANTFINFSLCRVWMLIFLQSLDPFGCRLCLLYTPNNSTEERCLAWVQEIIV